MAIFMFIMAVFIFVLLAITGLNYDGWKRKYNDIIR